MRLMAACWLLLCLAAGTPLRGEESPAWEPELRRLKQLVEEQARELEAHRRALEEQQEKMKRLEQLVERRDGQQGPAAPAPAPSAGKAEGDLRALEKRVEAVTGRLRGLGNFSFSGDLRVRYEPFFQGGGFLSRHRERVRARLNVLGALTEEVSGGLSVASGSLDDVNSTNQTLTEFFRRKTVGLDRYFLTYKPKWFRPLSLSAGKFAYTWYRTPLTFDSDLNPEGFSQTLSFDFKNRALKNLTVAGFELPFREASSGQDSFVLGGQVQSHWKLSDKAGLRLYAAGVNFKRADPLAVAVSGGELRPSLPNTNRLRRDSSGQVVGYASRFFYLDLIAALDYNLRPRWPILAQLNVVNNTRAADSERTGYWGEVQLGRLSEAGDVQVGYTFVRLERDAVLGAFNESDLPRRHQRPQPSPELQLPGLEERLLELHPVDRPSGQPAGERQPGAAQLS